jgi:hypothetical protein
LAPVKSSVVTNFGPARYDNLKPAVIKVLKGRNRTESDRFIALRSHYGFDSFLPSR